MRSLASADPASAFEDGCRRELSEETGLHVGELRLIGVYSDPSRDPRGHTCSVAYLARVGRAEVTAGDDAAAAEWVADWRRIDAPLEGSQIGQNKCSSAEVPNSGSCRARY